jgi:hypothetical protein
MMMESKVRKSIRPLYTKADLLNILHDVDLSDSASRTENCAIVLVRLVPGVLQDFSRTDPVKITPKIFDTDGRCCCCVIII